MPDVQWLLRACGDCECPWLPRHGCSGAPNPVIRAYQVRRPTQSTGCTIGPAVSVSRFCSHAASHSTRVVVLRFSRRRKRFRNLGNQPLLDFGCFLRPGHKDATSLRHLFKIGFDAQAGSF